MDCIVTEQNAIKIPEDWGSLTWMANQKLLNTEGLTVGRVVIKKGRSNPCHIHPNSEEVLYLLEGELMHRIGTETVRLKKGDTILIPANVPHYADSVGDVDADMIVTYPTNQRKIEFVDAPVVG